MFFSSKFIAILKKDHETIREHLSIVMDIERSYSERQEAFDDLTIVLASHTAREERVAYNYMRSFPELKLLSVVGAEEHRLVDHVVSKLKSERSAEVWEAEAQILSELIEHHLIEEENKIFPMIKKHLDDETDRKLRDFYIDVDISEIRRGPRTTPEQFADPTP